MNGLPKSRKITIALFMFGTSLLLSLVFIPAPVLGQVPFDLNWSFDYNPLVSAAPNSLHVRIHNTGLTPIRILSVGISFPWMQSGTYLSSGIPQTGVDVAPGLEAQFTIPFQIPADTLTGRYSMNTLLQYQVFQTNQYGGSEAIIYALGIVVLGSISPYSITFNPYDGRFYAAVAALTLVGWYLPKRLLHKTEG